MSADLPKLRQCIHKFHRRHRHVQCKRSLHRQCADVPATNDVWDVPSDRAGCNCIIKKFNIWWLFVKTQLTHWIEHPCDFRLPPDQLPNHRTCLANRNWQRADAISSHHWTCEILFHSTHLLNRLAAVKTISSDNKYEPDFHCRIEMKIEDFQFLCSWPAPRTSAPRVWQTQSCDVWDSGQFCKKTMAGF